MPIPPEASREVSSLRLRSSATSSSSARLPFAALSSGAGGASPTRELRVYVRCVTALKVEIHLMKSV